MADHETEVRTLIERWVGAVHTGDLTGVLADHSDDIVMYDVPPPYGGVRGIDAYRQTWSPFFEWQAQGALFELTSLDIVAGNTVAYAVALLRCGMPADSPISRNSGCDSPSACATRTAGGLWRTSTIHSPMRPAPAIQRSISCACDRGRRPKPPAISPDQHPTSG